MEDRLTQILGQRTQQTLTPMQMQFVRVLEMSGPEVEEHVREALDENPALEVADETAADGAETFGESAEEMQMADYGNPDDMPSTGFGGRGASGRDSAYEPVVTEHGETLYEAIMRQLRELEISDTDLVTGQYVAGNIDSNGYMARTIPAIADDIAINTGMDVDEDEVRRVWRIIRTLEPAGIGAVDLRDCLLLQLKRMPQSDSAVRGATEIVEHYFDVFSKMHLDRLRSLTGMGAEELADAIEVIKSLNPKPGALVGGSADEDRTRQITPDFVVEADPTDGRITVTLPNNIPALQIEQSFMDDTRLKGRDASAGALFLRQRRDEAATFIKVLSMRQQTLFNVMSAIVKLQREFFLTDDVKRLKPMILKDVSALTGYDLSVISRAASGKYVATAGGVYPLKFFFSERPGDNTEASAHEIMEAIRQIVAQEDKSEPLADAAIALKLKEAGYGIARRTVAKYREKLGIPVGRLRAGMKKKR